MDVSIRRARFEREVLPHLDAAYNLARWLLRNDQDAEDVTQDSMLRAYRFFDGFRGANAKAWLLAIVRNASYSWLARKRVNTSVVGADVPHRLDDGDPAEVAATDETPESLLAVKVELAVLQGSLDELPTEYREILVLRELEELSYKEISAAIDVPLGTVMSRLSRARALLQRKLALRLRKEDGRGV
jgi:RNA polymerase sigma-70 factor (ECF subfamily)